MPTVSSGSGLRDATAGSRMARVLGNITDNTIRYAPSDSSVTISIVMELVAAVGGDAYMEMEIDPIGETYCNFRRRTFFNTSEMNEILVLTIIKMISVI
jgi:hypothetical protein